MSDWLERFAQRASDIANYSAQPMWWNRPPQAQYLGGRPGPDIADPIDIGVSLAATAARAVDATFVRPAVHGIYKAGTKIAGLVGEPILSQDDFDAYLERLGESGSLQSSEGPIEDPKEFFSSKDHPTLYHSYKEGAGGSYFRPGTNWVAHDPETGGIPSDLGEGYDKHTDLIESPVGVHLRETVPGTGVEPIVAAEEVQHGAHHLGYPDQEYDLFKLMTEGGGRLSMYLDTIKEETSAKAKSVKHTYNTEGIAETVASLPVTLGTWLSYAIPSTHTTHLGETKTQLYGSDADLSVIEGSVFLDYIGTLGYPNIGAFMQSDWNQALVKETGFSINKETGEANNFAEYTHRLMDELGMSYRDKETGEIDHDARYQFWDFYNKAMEIEEQHGNPLKTIKAWWDR